MDSVNDLAIQFYLPTLSNEEEKKKFTEHFTAVRDSNDTTLMS